MYIDNEGNIYRELKEGVDLTEVTIECPDDLEGYVGEIWFDERSKCLIDDRERAYWYKVENNELVKYDWLKRYESGEFTLEDFKNKVLKLIKSNYVRDIQSTDSMFIAYQKRKELDLLETGDEESYLSELDYYKNKTLEYRQLKNLVLNAATIESLIDIYK